MAGRGPLTEDLIMEEDEKQLLEAEKQIWRKGFSCGVLFSAIVIAVICYFGQPAALTVWKDGGLTPKQAKSVVNKTDALLRKWFGDSGGG